MSKTKEQKVYLKDLHFEHVTWLNELNFLADELASFTNRLEEVSIRWTDSVVKAEVEHFQNQFIRQKEIVDIYMHDIKKDEHKLVEYAEEHPVAIDHVKFADHTGMREKIETNRLINAELKNNFFKFLGKYM